MKRRIILELVLSRATMTPSICALKKWDADPRDLPRHSRRWDVCSARRRPSGLQKPATEGRPVKMYLADIFTIARTSAGIADLDSVRFGKPMERLPIGDATGGGAFEEAGCCKWHRLRAIRPTAQGGPRGRMSFPS